MNTPYGLKSVEYPRQLTVFTENSELVRVGTSEVCCSCTSHLALSTMVNNLTVPSLITSMEVLLARWTDQGEE